MVAPMMQSECYQFIRRRNAVSSPYSPVVIKIENTFAVTDMNVDIYLDIEYQYRRFLFLIFSCLFSIFVSFARKDDAYV